MSEPSKRRAVNTCTRCQRLKLKCDRARPCGSCTRSHGAECTYGAGSLDADTDTDAAPPRPRKRHRAVLVCTRCKRLRVKCDQERPCGACVAAKRGHGCVFVPWPDEVGQGEPAAATAPAPAPSSSAPTPHRGLEHDHTALHAHARAIGLEDTEPDNYHVMRARIAELEARLDGLASSVATPATSISQLASYSPSKVGGLASLAGRFPPPDEARRLLRDFLNFDLMFRTVHAASFTRRCEAALAATSWEDADAPFLAMFAGALLVAAASTTVRTMMGTAAARAAAEERETRLRALMDALLAYCEDRGELGLDYVHARLIAVLTHMTGESSSPAKMWLALGKAGSAALLAGLHRDRAGESMFDKEMRRRVWWQIVFLSTLTAERMNIGYRPTFPDVPRPAVVADGVLDTLSAGDATTSWTGIPEWGYVDAKLLWNDYFVQRDVLLANESVPLLDRLANAAALINKLGAAMPGYLTIDNHPYHSPPWVHMQAVIMTIALDEAHVHLYRPHFGAADPELAATALSKAVEAAHRLVDDIRMMTTYMLFSWIDAPTTALWTYGMKSFTGGMVMAYALLSGPDDPLRDRHQADLDLVIGVLKSNLNMAGSSRSNAQALRTLEGMRATILARSGLDAGDSGADADPRDVVDPYTGRTVPLPRAVEDVDLPGEWVEWDVLFRELFQGALPLPAA